MWPLLSLVCCSLGLSKLCKCKCEHRASTHTHSGCAGFLDPRNFPLEPRTESAFAAISAELDRLSALLPSTSGAGTSGAGGTQGAGAAQSSGGKGNRFKPLSIMVPENQVGECGFVAAHTACRMLAHVG